jgi:hypothetical protein
MSRRSNREERIKKLRKDPRFRALVEDLQRQDPDRVDQMAREYLSSETEVDDEGQESDTGAEE